MVNTKFFVAPSVDRSRVCIFQINACIISMIHTYVHIVHLSGVAPAHCTICVYNLPLVETCRHTTIASTLVLTLSPFFFSFLPADAPGGTPHPRDGTVVVVVIEISGAIVVVAIAVVIEDSVAGFVPPRPPRTTAVAAAAAAAAAASSPSSAAFPIVIFVVVSLNLHSDLELRLIPRPGRGRGGEAVMDSPRCGGRTGGERREPRAWRWPRPRPQSRGW